MYLGRENPGSVIISGPLLDYELESVCRAKGQITKRSRTCQIRQCQTSWGTT
jgi:hypothetical protein